MRAVLFDLDGTLFDTRVDLTASANALRRHYGQSAYSVAEVSALVGDGLGALIRRLVGETVPQQEARALFSSHYDQQCTQHPQPFPGMRQLLLTLKQQGWMLAVVSNKPHRWCAAIVQALAWSDLLPLIIGGDHQRKPDPEPLQQACAALAVDPSQAIMVGDHGNDIMAAKAAGCSSVFVHWGFAKLPPEVQPDYQCQSVDELGQCLARWRPGHGGRHDSRP